MKNIFLYILLISFTVVSCGSDEESLQRIDQVLNIYVKDTNQQDLLNSKKAGSYTGYSVNDVFGSKDISPVTISLRMRTDSVFYMEYIGGAKRRKLDSTGPANPGSGNAYVSKMAITFTKTVNNTVERTVDQLEIHYRKSPTLFQVSEVLYNGKSEFSKEADAPTSINNVTITK
ncbi:hypothetical protein [Chryseobacterium sp. BIGb0232]|uniref:hypothetical protein n=1 Tax=Chryseobacterium sp. BIGb0232 TaxID=2940598 RepID=UPI000F4989E0|nr:hypothetical protein [Chryseobacterium sp. BIGb0232]MCS4303630.1 hypothetical protein [Chryseobacterium sp. BIGb0232]ROS10329.1 hypothetical protein EDF65_4210 [Chryseobacterium nakagawai]